MAHQAKLIVSSRVGVHVRQCSEEAVEIGSEPFLKRFDFILFEPCNSAFPDERDLAARDRIGRQDRNVVEFPNREESVFAILSRSVDLFQLSPDHFGFFEPRLGRQIVHRLKESLVEIGIPPFDKSDRFINIFEIARSVDVVVAGAGAGMHLEIKAVGMRIVAANIVETWPQLEGAFKRCLETRELASGNERPKIFHTGLDLPARVDAGKPLFSIHFHQGEQAEGPHLAVCLRKMILSLSVKDVERFESGIGFDVFDASGNLAQIQVANAFRSFAVVAQEPFEEITGLIEND